MYVCVCVCKYVCVCVFMYIWMYVENKPHFDSAPTKLRRKLRFYTNCMTKTLLSKSNLENKNLSVQQKWMNFVEI